MLRLFPLILIVVIIYNFLAFGGWAVGDHNLQPFLQSHGVNIPLVSGDKWMFSLADLFLLVTLSLLFVEIIKATRTTSREIINHALSMLTFVVALIEFIALKGFATSTFFFMMIMSLFDVVAGYTISIVAAEHDLGLGRAGTD
jgi:hypothetical protein